MTTRSRVAALAATLPLLLGVAACSDTAPETKSAVGAPKPKVKAAPPMRLTTATFMPTMNTANKKVRSMEAIARVSAGGQVFTVKVAETIKPFGMKMDMSTPRGVMTMIMVKNGVYGSGAGIPTGKYRKINVGRDSDAQLKALADMMESADPTKAYEAWNKAGIKVKFVKRETLGFRKVDRYQVIVPIAAVLGSEAKNVPKGVKLPKTVGYAVWMGTDHLPYKLSFKLLELDMQMTITGYNTVGAITAPPANKLVK
jgi:hypothetical protein